MTGYYDFQLVVLSLFVAIVASYTALELAGRVSQTEGGGSWAWLIGGALAMGTGIWSMHFIAMLAFHLPITLAYDAWITVLSMAIAVVVSGLALFVVRRPTMTGQSITAGATLMGAGISAMHYTGMQAMRMSPSIEYHPLLFIASVIIAMAASLAALWIAFQLRRKHFGAAFLAKLGSALIMGLAITGMHYTGMAATQFAPDSVCLAADSTEGMSSAALALVIGIITICILTLTLVLSALDAQFANQTANLADSLRETNKQLRDLALYDNLTGLPNRMLLDDRMTRAAENADRGGKSFALMFVDLDRFKPVNDTYGHGVGDRLLMDVAKRLVGCIRKVDTTARIGGDEFIVILSEIGSREDAAMVGRKILDELARPFFVDRHLLSISCSIGVAFYPDDGREMYTLKANADVAMYYAKQNGRNKFCFYAPTMTMAALQ